jgi:HTH-type transcriptional regulator / antitoxin HigA
MIKSTVQTSKVMAKIKTEKQYKGATERIEELLKIVGNNTPVDDKNYIELDLLSDLVADYEEEYYPITAPTLVETIKLRMFEMNLTQLKLSELLGISPSRVSEYLSGKSEPTLKVAREISKKLNIDANIVLGI